MVKRIDTATIDALVAHGADLGRARQTNHYFYTRQQKSAQLLAARLAKEGREIDVHESGAEWRVVVSFVMLVGPSSITGVRREFESAAAATGATYEGWEASTR